jgi:4-amino-4-deoxy-L-arabinose transferase-like glycosyltransferase
MDMEVQTDSSSARYQRLDILLLVVAGVLVFFTLGSRMLWGSEGRWAEVTREMMLTHDYFHPTINGEPYFDKPLFTYWLIAGVALVLGRLDELVVRLPSAIMGFAAIWATLRMGRRLWSPAVGRIAAFIVMTCYGVLLWSRSGAADTENLATVILCTLWYWYRRERLGFATLLLLYLLAFTGSHMKGPVAAVVTAIVIFPDAIGSGRWKAFLRPGALLALAIGLAVFFAPFIWAAKTNPATYGSSGLALVWQENVQRFTSPVDHRNSIFTYVWSVPVLIMPWAPLFVCGLVVAIREWRNLDSSTRWLVKAIALVFVFFTLAGSRRNYYILPIIPLCSLLTAVAWTRMKEGPSASILRCGFDIQKYLLLGTAVVELVGGIVFLVVPLKKAGVSLASICLASIIVASVAMIAGLAVHRAAGRFSAQRQEMAFLPLAAVAAVVMGGFFCIQQPVMEKYQSEREFIAKLRIAAADLSAERIALLQKSEVDAKMVFYVGKESPVTLLRYNATEQDKTRLAGDAAAVASFIRDGRPGVLIAQARYIADLPAECRSLLSQTPDICEDSVPFESKSARTQAWQAWLLGPNRISSVSTPTGDKPADAK